MVVEVAERPENINSIVETVDRYNPENLPQLEEYVRDQMINNTVDRTANLAVLKLYQFNPHLTSIAIVANILALALASLPDPDFNLSLCLLNEETMADPQIDRLVQMQALLEHCEFSQFWKLLEEGGEDQMDIMKEFPEFDNRVRRFISTTVAATYQSISVPLLSSYLNLDGEDLADWISIIGATANADSPNLIDFPSSSKDGTSGGAPAAAPSVARESIKFEQLTKIVGVSRIIA